MEKEIDLTSVILMLGETNSRLKELGEYLGKIDKKIAILNNNSKKDLKSVLGANNGVRMVFTVKRTVADR